jgi:hypothetical protein
MKKVFISYSIEDSNLHLITLLLEHLRKNNYSVSISTQWGNTDARIAQSDVFIGIINNNSNSINYVVEEWKVANDNNIQYVLIVEDGVQIDEASKISYIRFNRTNPQDAIDKLFNIRKPTNTSTNKKKNNNETLSNVLIGATIIAGIAALISLLSKNK